MKYARALEFVADLWIDNMQGDGKKSGDLNKFKESLFNLMMKEADRKWKLDVFIGIGFNPDKLLAQAISESGIGTVFFPQNSMTWVQEEPVTEQIRVRYKMGNGTKVQSVYFDIDTVDSELTEKVTRGNE
jgi:hypothetical protein